MLGGPPAFIEEIKQAVPHLSGAAREAVEHLAKLERWMADGEGAPSCECYFDTCSVKKQRQRC